MSLHRDDHLMISLQRLLNGVGDAARELIAASRLLRARIESNDAVLNTFQDRLDQQRALIDEINRRVTALENMGGHAHP